MKLKGKVALITGGGTGIGAAIAERFIEEGALVCISGRRQEMLDKVAKKLPSGKVTTYAGDVSNEEVAKQMVEATVDFGGHLDVLVNNAALNVVGPITDLKADDWRHVLDVNLTGPFLLMQASIPHMIKAGGGSIINIASVGGTRCLPYYPAYCASKAGLIMLTQQAALDYGPHNIRCNSVCPGGVKTDMTASDFGQFGKMIGMEPDEYLDLIAEEIPLRRFAKPEEMGGICTFLASDDASFTTGSTILVDAGTSVVDVVGASIMGSLRRKGIKL
jgi:NAD(P)-dependent dehydrogenase (short-subunit alcohol dehydrogenase family)